MLWRLSLALLLALSACSAHPLSGYLALNTDAADELMTRLKTVFLKVSDNNTICWRDAYGRGIGVPIYTCSGNAQDPDQSGLLCYPYCRTVRGLNFRFVQ